MRAKEYLKLRGLNLEVEKVELSVDGLASIMEQYADGMVHEQVKSVDLADVSGSLPDTRGDKIRKHINPCNHFIDWIIDNGQPQYKVLYDKLEQYKNERYGNGR